MNEKTLKIAISSQKGGVGKSTCTILVAGVLHYLTATIPSTASMCCASGTWRP